MRWQINILSLLFATCALLSAGVWTAESAGFEFDPFKGRGKLHGPVSLTFEGWKFSSSREALVTAKSTIVKKTDPEGVRDYRLLKEPARVVFLGTGLVEDAKGKAVLEAPFLILSMETMTVTAKGSGIVVREGSSKRISDDNESGVVLDLKTGQVRVKGPGW